MSKRWMTTFAPRIRRALKRTEREAMDRLDERDARAEGRIRTLGDVRDEDARIEAAEQEADRIDPGWRERRLEGASIARQERAYLGCAYPAGRRRVETPDDDGRGEV